jgi:hypothetical protein
MAKKAKSKMELFEKSKMDKVVDKATKLKEGSKGDKAIDKAVMKATAFGGKRKATGKVKGR